MALSYSTLRALWFPPCKDSGKDLLAAWKAFDTILRKWKYGPDADSGFYNCRAVTGGHGYSMHSYPDNTTLVMWNGRRFNTLALAFDLNPTKNPYGPRLVTNIPRGMFDDILKIRTNSGKQVFQAGAYYSGNKDAMHFEIVVSPADLRTGIDADTVHGEVPVPAPVPETGVKQLYRIIWYTGEPSAAGDQKDQSAAYRCVMAYAETTKKYYVTDAIWIEDLQELAQWRERGLKEEATRRPISGVHGTVRFFNGPFDNTKTP